MTENKHQQRKLRIIHTSDWHIGKMLYGRRRDAEHATFLRWLETRLIEDNIDILIVAGDIFDTATPTHRAQELYYDFLARLSQTPVRHTIITGGNHDSPTLIDAPRDLLGAMNIHVVGCAEPDLSKEVIPLYDSEGRLEAVVGAVPYLRDRDVRLSQGGQSQQEKDRDVMEGIKTHYQKVQAEAERLRKQRDIPLIMMGHLFTDGGIVREGDGVRDLYVGSLSHIPPSSFDHRIDYLALGHLHVAQDLNGDPTRRYSGSPIPMGFGEIKDRKSVVRVDFIGRRSEIQLLDVPRERRLESLRGDWHTLEVMLAKLIEEDQEVWTEVIYQGSTWKTDLRERVQEICAGTKVDVLRIRNEMKKRTLTPVARDLSLIEIKIEDVFTRLLDEHQVAAEERGPLVSAFSEVLSSLHEEDPQAE